MRWWKPEIKCKVTTLITSKGCAVLFRLWSSSSLEFDEPWDGGITSERITKLANRTSSPFLPDTSICATQLWFLNWRSTNQEKILTVNDENERNCRKNSRTGCLPVLSILIWGSLLLGALQYIMPDRNERGERGFWAHFGRAFVYLRGGGYDGVGLSRLGGGERLLPLRGRWRGCGAARRGKENCLLQSVGASQAGTQKPVPKLWCSSDGVSAHLPALPLLLVRADQSSRNSSKFMSFEPPMKAADLVQNSNFELNFAENSKNKIISVNIVQNEKKNKFVLWTNLLAKFQFFLLGIDFYLPRKVCPSWTAEMSGHSQSYLGLSQHLLLVSSINHLRQYFVYIPSRWWVLSDMQA